MESRVALIREPGRGSYYGQLAQTLREQIQLGEFAAGDRLPAETELAKAFGVSRPVVRQALGLLQREGLLYRVQGKGTFVIGKPFRSRVMQVALGPESDTVRFRSRLETKVIFSEVEEPTLATAKELGLPPSAKVVHLRRVRYFDDGPLAILESHIPRALAPGLETVDLVDQSLYEQLEVRFGLRIARLHRSIEAAAIEAGEAKLLDVRSGTPCLRVSSLAMDAKGATIELSLAVYRADKITLVTELDTSAGDFHLREDRERS